MNDKKIPASLRKLVKRPQFKDGKPAGEREIALKEVFDWSETDDEVSIITVDGQRFTAAKTEPAANPKTGAAPNPKTGGDDPDGDKED